MEEACKQRLDAEGAELYNMDDTDSDSSEWGGIEDDGGCEMDVEGELEQISGFLDGEDAMYSDSEMNMD
jgi:hypothetical protein